MAYLLFPGRHLAITKFQERYLREILARPIHELGEKIDTVIFAITSSNQEHSRYNPIPFYLRAIGIDRFARSLREELGISFRVVGIPHFDPNERFVELLLKEIYEETPEHIQLTPKNTSFLSSTPAVIALAEKLGFHIFSAELDPRAGSYTAPTPIKMIQRLSEVGEKWHNDAFLQEHLSSATRELWGDFPEVPATVVRLWRDPLLTEGGDLTATRDYSTYAFGMAHREIIKIKYDDIRAAIVPGKIVDEGCADGALLVELARDFPDSDLIGIEITGEFIARAKERQRAGEFGGTFVYFHQRNLMAPIFEPESIDTTICNSTLHELWSYGGGKETIDTYLHEKYLQTTPQGRLVIRDVVGPEQGGKEVYLWTSAAARAQFDPFARDFLEPRKRSYREETVQGKTYLVMRLRDAMEFLLKKDYTDNWESEMHEEFCFWSFSEWKEALARAGFLVFEDPANPTVSSRAYTSSWIAENRLSPHAGLFEKKGEDLRALPWPPTNIVLIGEKRTRA